MNSQTAESKLAQKLNKAATLFQGFKQSKNKVNQHMEGKYSSTLIALVATVFASIIMILILFLPNYLGVADDGSVSPVMKAAGVYYTQTEVSDIYNNYFVKQYSNVLSGYEVKDAYFNSQVVIVKAAVLLDNLITKDKFFDIRFLAFIYGCLYVPAFFLLVKQACIRVTKFSEGIVIAFVGVLMFSDVAYLTYFNSFYPEAIWFISLMYCLGAALSFQTSRSSFRDLGSLILIVIAGTVLTTSRKQTALIGILLAVFCLKLLFTRRHWIWGIFCVMSAFFLTFLSITCLIQMSSDFNETSKFHAMTRGVLFESDHPAKTLSEFGIPSSYEILTDVSTYDYLPLVQANDIVLKKDFLDRYSPLDISTYYVRHPGSLLGMWDVAIKSCYGIRREYCGNYEASAGMPARAKSIVWSGWSTFKNNSLPKTFGFLVVLVVAIIMLFGKGYSIRPSEDRRSTIFIDMMMVLLLICLSQATVTIINSGDAEMVQHCFLISFGFDIMIYFVFAEVAHKINIF